MNNEDNKKKKFKMPEMPWSKNNHEDETMSRTARRKHSKTTGYIIWGLIAIVVLIAVVAFASGVKKQSAVGVTPQSSSVKTSSKAKKSSSASSIKTVDVANHPTKTVNKVRDPQRSTNNVKNGFVTVKAGQGVYRVAYNAGITEEQLYKLNGIAPGSSIKPGQKLRVR